MLGASTAHSIENATQDFSKAIKNSNRFEQMVFFLLKEKEKVVIELFNKGLKRKENFDIYPNHDSNEADCYYC